VASAPAVKFICHLDGREFANQAELTAYVRENYSERIFADSALDAEIEEEVKVKRTRASKEKTS